MHYTNNATSTGDFGTNYYDVANAINSLAKFGISARDTYGNFKNLSDLLLELQKVWECSPRHNMEVLDAYDALITSAGAVNDFDIYDEDYTDSIDEFLMSFAIIEKGVDS